MKITLRLNPGNMNADLLTQMGYALENGNEFCQDYEAALQIYQAAASMPNGEIAENNLAWMHLNGRGVEEDVPEAIRLFENAAERGSSVSMVNLGNIYENGIGDEEPNYPLALYWYKRAAEAGNTRGLFNLANMYHNGWGVRKNRTKAYEIFAELYKKGYPGTAFYMGLYHQHGYVVEQDYSKAYCYYLEGARVQNDVCCFNQLGIMYAQGYGVEKDYTAALAYYRQAAEMGDDLSMANIGYCYEVGQGVESDMNEALRWYKEAAKYGNEHAIEALQRLESK